MATITTSEVIESSQRAGYKRNRYKYTLSTGGVYYEIGWIPTATSDAADMAMRGDLLLTQLAEQEAGGLIDG